MKRYVLNYLNSWKNDVRRKPLLIRGARQVGKSYVVQDFAKKNFSSIVTVDLEQKPEISAAFNSLDPKQIISQLGLLYNQPLEPGKTLLFIDEIQKSPKAIMALRYFYEQFPELHVIAAGSLLEFALEAQNFSFPVGRVESLFLHPMSFLEFLRALGKDSLADHVENSAFRSGQPAVHEELNRLVRSYFVVGGMPEAVQTYTETGDLARVARVHETIIQTFRDDFGKYARLSSHRHLETVFSAAPRLAGNKFQYKRVEPESNARELKAALGLLVRAGVVRQVFRTSVGQLPLAAGMKENHFKVLALDIGLMTTQIGIGGEVLRSSDLLSAWNGVAAEQFVGQELVAYATPFRQPELFYWGREEYNSRAEIDYIVQKEGKALPIEVKSGAPGRMKSMHLFLEKYALTVRGVRFCAAPYREEARFTSLPLYAVFSV
ncbi:MAG: hypothetical protein A2268_05605 [Candidatus Raymondbacteria bacterium RifOxyA12_full_50_37]|uniref:ATPase n=1 Tax=Candidatus Raymondbacteria bacterium RIFOXYD12_FULL_49_13 TaxID=1817890 RepID=A0A1F7F5G7_UNCRA|nr:MAG: hypothetical protein A2268_05605 [Candidatus Raymondbacteria bacterium RifOxyA12_full_50_37]OGJ89040.1 MAG: hypothetical protein A2248_02840 [Candidatus Raymondbacteria bacterium RIFOXYA2_FULL_49_16]OGJ97067.1 MAG: hypothetical protein A2453_04255 [Candidatus Raymondbacteria bacterium RIFOXYC2_FULL_50_21]OGK01777.1 MAG: hypothetical protein A2519_01700 [Candidatus Raymondbacteria bacterium RIFOXYD12_FULL_49_13]OGK02752.1 MAG: hypothetical protein A2487_01100 [Candidatus Raymondbacteria 